MYKKHVLLILAFALILSLTTTVNSTSEEGLEFLRDYAVQNYGLDNGSIELQYIAVDLRDFNCSDWYAHMICQAGFRDKYDKTVELYWDKDTGKIYDYKPSFHQLHPEVSKRILSELYMAMKNSPNTEKLPIVIVSGSEVIEEQKKELETLGMSVARPLEDGGLLGPNNWVQGSANSSSIERIADLTWISYIFHNPLHEDVFDVIESNHTEIIILSALIVTNSIDKVAAERLKAFLTGFDLYVNITNASGFKTDSYGFDAIFILGGPMAYEGIGNISTEYLLDSEKEYLIHTPNSERSEEHTSELQSH